LHFKTRSIEVSATTQPKLIDKVWCLVAVELAFKLHLERTVSVKADEERHLWFSQNTNVRTSTATLRCPSSAPMMKTELFS